MRKPFCLAALLISAVANPSSASATEVGAAGCADLAKLKLPGTSIVRVEAVTTGAFQPPQGAFGGTAPIAGLPPFCRVVAEIDPEIGVEVWLPLQRWNGRFFGVGIGGFGGGITYSGGNASLPGLADALRRGYAAAATDTGHRDTPKDETSGYWGIGHPDRIKTYAYSSIHEMTVKGKALTLALYGTHPTFSYFSGCSGGGRQGLVEASRFPEDYDGIVAYAPANPITHAVGWILAASVAVHRDPAGALAPEQIALITREVIKKCDAVDGVVDENIEDPRRCTFDIRDLQCQSGQAADCLTATQLRGIRAYYEPLRNQQGQIIFAGMPPGSDMTGGQALAVLSNRDPARPSPHPGMWAFAKMFEQDANYGWRSFDPIKTVRAWDEKYRAMMDGTPDLRRFRARGGKVILLQGWQDGGITPGTTIDYYKKAVEKTAGIRVTDDTPPDANDFIRLFLAPGVNHCAGGLGQTLFDGVSAVAAWRETGVPPAHIIASRMSVTSGQIDRARPLCPFPQTSLYKGSGNIDDAVNFACRTRSPASR